MAIHTFIKWENLKSIIANFMGGKTIKFILEISFIWMRRPSNGLSFCHSRNLTLFHHYALSPSASVVEVSWLSIVLLNHGDGKSVN